MVANCPLVRLPSQARATSWPTERWPRAQCGVPLPSELLEPGPKAHGETKALIVVHRGELVVDRYPTGLGPDAKPTTWSLAKSISHAIVGIAIGDGLLELRAPIPVAAWADPKDHRGAITLEQLLQMTDGLDFAEYGLADGHSDGFEMVEGSAKADAAGFAESKPLIHSPGQFWNYSSGSTNIITRALGRLLGGEEAMRDYLETRLFRKLGMRSAEPRFDSAGTFIGGSRVFSTAEDFARLGLLYLRDGVWEGQRILPEGWVDHARTPTRASKGVYGAHWWLDIGPSGAFTAKGHHGQYILIDPERDLVIVRLGETRLTRLPRVDADLQKLCFCFD